MSFKERLKTSCLYITHDLNIASYIADNIVVLCHGRVVEEGPKDDVIRDPLHPYTRLLISSIAVPNPRRRWKEMIDITTIESFEKLKVRKGCVFSLRCPYAMDKCRREVPEPVEIAPDRRVMCFLYKS